MERGADINPATMRPYGFKDEERIRSEKEELESLQNQVKHAACFESESAAALILVVENLLDKRILHFLEKDPAGQVCMEFLKTVDRSQSAARLAAKRLIKKIADK